ncbi:HNH endonuclease family protein [Xylanivirga thermophila]|uniref:HNH endonuclease family protein n=1 Tax=Xylanivirga thermophila TaxID=2496273 RepID=UPI00101CCF17|nr:DUF262 domain-containing protein [Xylanivirga thermophila]
MDIKEKVFTEQKDFTLSQLREMVADGDLITNPDYQRDYVYNDKQASKLIESILIGIPIPTIYLSEEDEGIYSVIDGQQRITSFVNFLDNKFKLSGLKELIDLNGKYFKNLEKEIQRKLKSSTLKAICILKESNHLKYEIFARLNQGSVSLKPQELRNCIYRGRFNSMLEEIADYNNQLPLLFHDSNKRKTYQERILRFFALRNFTEYGSSMLQTMNKYMEIHQNDSPEEINKQKTLFNGTIDIVKQVLGDNAFDAYDREKGIMSNKFSGSVYDSIVIPFSFFSKHELMIHANEIRVSIDELKISNEEYQECTYAATGSKRRVTGRIMIVYNLLKKITGSMGNDEGDRVFSASIKKELWKSGYICSYCGNEILNIDDAEVDHIVPYSQGGMTEISNAQLLHRHCNRAKSDSIESDWEEDEDI